MRRFVLTAALAGVALTVAVPLQPISAAALAAMSVAQHKIYGNVVSVRGSTLIIRTRTGRLLTVDGHLAHSSVLLTRNRPVIVYGTVDAAGLFHANAVWRTYPDAAHWPADR